MEAQCATPDSMFRFSITVQLLIVGLVAGGPLNPNESKDTGIDEILGASTEYLKHIITSQLKRPDFDVNDLKMRMMLTFMDFLELLPSNKSGEAEGDSQSKTGIALLKFDEEEMIQYTEDILDFFQRLMKRIFKNQMKNPDFKVQDIHNTLTSVFQNFFDMVSLYVNERPKERALDVPEQREVVKLKFNDPFDILFEVVKAIGIGSFEIVKNIAIPFFMEFGSVIREEFRTVLAILMESSGNKLYFLFYETFRILLDWEDTETKPKKLYKNFATYIEDEVESEQQETIKTTMQVILNFSNNLSTVLGELVQKLHNLPVAKDKS